MEFPIIITNSEYNVLLGIYGSPEVVKNTLKNIVKDWVATRVRYVKDQENQNLITKFDKLSTDDQLKVRNILDGIKS